MSQVVWYCHIGDQMLGPLTSYQLMEMARSGRLREADTVKNADTDWIEARQVAGLEFDSRELVPPPPSTDARPNDNGTDHLGLSASSLAMAGVLIAILGGMGILGLVVALLITSQNGSNPSPSASTDYVALQTKAAWDQMQASDIYLTSRLGNGVGTYEAVFLERAEFWAERVTQYSMIDTDYVDEELTEHIRRWITLSHQTRTCNEMFVQEVKQLEAAVASFTQLLASTPTLAISLGSSPTNPFVSNCVSPVGDTMISMILFMHISRTTCYIFSPRCEILAADVNGQFHATAGQLGFSHAVTVTAGLDACLLDGVSLQERIKVALLAPEATNIKRAK